MYIHIHICVYTHIYIFIYIYVYKCIRIYISMHMSICIQMYVCTYFHIHIQTHTGVLGGSSLSWAPRAFRRLDVGARTERYVCIYTSSYRSQCANSYITYTQYIHVYTFLDWRVHSLWACKLKNTYSNAYSSLFVGKSMYIYTTYTYIYTSQRANWMVIRSRCANSQTLRVRTPYIIYVYTKISFMYIPKYTPCSLRSNLYIHESQIYIHLHMPRSLRESKVMFRFRCANSYTLNRFICIYVCLILGSQIRPWRANSIYCIKRTKELIHSYTVCIHLHMPRSRHANSYIHTRAYSGRANSYTHHEYIRTS